MSDPDTTPLEDYTNKWMERVGCKAILSGVHPSLPDTELWGFTFPQGDLFFPVTRGLLRDLVDRETFVKEILSSVEIKARNQGWIE